VHTRLLASGVKLKAADAGALLPDGYRDKAAYNPENLFVATYASAHMLSWLHVAFGVGARGGDVSGCGPKGADGAIRGCVLHHRPDFLGGRRHDRRVM
jgi:hypothetical protein